MELSEQIAMVLAVFGLLGGLVWFAKRRGLASFPSRRSASTRRLEILERIQLTPHHAVHLVRVAEKVVLIATAPSACTLLETPVPSEAPFSIPQDLLFPGK